MEKYLTLFTIFLAVLVITSCSPGLQTYNKHNISFTVTNELKLVEYKVDPSTMTKHIGESSYQNGMIMSSEGNFVLLWVLTTPKYTDKEIRISILSTPDSFESNTGKFKATITSDLLTTIIAGFEITYAKMNFTLPNWSASGITAVWYCPDSQRTFQIILINNKPETEMRRFIRSFSCIP